MLLVYLIIVLQRRPTTTSHNDVPQRRPTTTSHSDVSQQRPTTTSHNDVPQRRPTTTSHNDVSQQRPTTTSHNDVSQRRPTTTSHNDVSQRRPTTTSHNDVPQRRLTTTSHNDVSQRRLTTTSHNDVSQRRPTTTSHNDVSQQRPTTTSHNDVPQQRPTTTSHNKSKYIMCFRWSNDYSSSFTVSNGVKKGGILSPILFNVYMDDFSVKLNSSNIGGRIEDIFLNHLCYADDLCLISLSPSGMQKLLGICSKYAIDYSLTYIANKSFSLCFIPCTIKFGRLYMNNLLIPNVSECQYLGTIICQKYCDRDIKRQTRTFCANVNMLLRRFSECSTPVKCYMFKTYCSNLYCASLWYNSTVTAMKN